MHTSPLFEQMGLTTTETRETNPMVLHVATNIASGIDWWLREEVASSGKDHNVVLDDYDAFVDAITNQEGVPRIPLDAKFNSHHSRLIDFTAAFHQHPSDPYIFARQMFCILMCTSGAFREQARLGATDQEDYLKRRRSTESPIGINLLDTVVDRVWWHRFMKNINEPLDSAALVEETLHTNQVTSEWMEFLKSRGKADLQKDPSETIEMAKIAQTLWVNLAVDYALFWEKQNDQPFGYADTPILEPKSITHGPEIIYPFRRSA